MTTLVLLAVAVGAFLYARHRKRLREITRDPSASGAADEAAALRGEHRRLSRPERAPAASRAVAEPDVSDPEAEAIAT
uniref:Uncharacterized protein n=1 Tax=Streptomyces sp. NBC_00093 TaxID=2975649 RepID=A0AAU1ZTZ4_9ACTN